MNTRQQLKEHTEQAKEAVISDDAIGAYRLAEELSEYVKKKGLKRSDQEVYKRYLGLIAKLKWIALSILPREEVLAHFESSFQDALNIPYFNLKDKLREVMIEVVLLEERDKYKKEIKGIVDRNRAMLTKGKAGEGKNGTVENWIKTYISDIGLKKADSIKFENFFTSNKYANSLPAPEKSKLKDFFFFYEYLKTSSLTPEGLEERPVFEVDGQVKVMEDGKLEPVKLTKLQQKIARIVDETLKSEEQEKQIEKQEKGMTEAEKAEARKKRQQEEKIRAKVLNLQKMLENYPKGSLEHKVVEEEIKKLKIGS
ncbi:hypothetical protein GF382_02875 [Candidatus Falkowbacteria bacterium]|nr:hypothetical protein [Candidatus Falkowbacteria bacterium]